MTAESTRRTFNNKPLREAARRTPFLLLFSALWLTGALWLAIRWMPEAATFFIQEYLDTFLLQGWLMRIHGLLAMLSLVFLGLLWAPHIRSAWRRNQNRTSGSLLLGNLVVLAITGYGIYYFTGSWRSGNAYIHWATGLAVLFAVLFHLPRKHRLKDHYSG